MIYSGLISLQTSEYLPDEILAMLLTFEGYSLAILTVYNMTWIDFLYQNTKSENCSHSCFRMYTNYNLQMFLFFYFLRSVNLSIAVILFTEDFVCLLSPYTADWKVLSFVLEITC